ncbi:MAG: (E)-4-hydroxy-3-methylbut-2-enyl-diphosphate synthase [Candidatus Eisenbacteria bacterium]|uniref:4-hydroxy-3-methylbut-2-en-1-yl diphosphate synthase (flavodoxin) n=1 Tax=Eiseniibacteriota bacterium TaxID=2212470 RepID=A0A948W3C6_UNCEI|nr:(E)-4-hydroxy-3-methylbut-2-enyl-diphosphate synthase [Candidatus Eisenbacteria bacterium]MBU1950528.1 (E)-4-hydroxy-3-methylbut-2-enyl-diphosphate synthase [Candidatus Eisenbacteria bacterium]MBU2690937.1 (E)-4-hydroxy-3-methylbut-2-enyl-diphosphate synthase [Candidatus Eisenbacteria bacterium]
MSSDSRQKAPKGLPLPYRRRPTRVVRVGHLAIGGPHPILIQSMTTSDTMDTQAVCGEIEGLVSAGCPLVRLTCPSIREADHLAVIKAELRRRGLQVPLVADIHFTPNAALRAAELVEKVRINPGNYADRKKNAVREYSDAQYREELERIQARFKPLVLKCKEHGAALRIGTNHGSLSDRIMNRYGDTPLGMVESALEFVRICRNYDFHNIVLSLKSSVTSVVIEAHRLLIAQMDAEKMDYPIHLGITEAGSGWPARLKSAVGIGGLLSEGIGDTIRVSLTEPSVNEIAACREILAGVARVEPAFAAFIPAGMMKTDGPPPGPPAGAGGPCGDAPVSKPVTLPAPRIVERIELGTLPLGGPAPVPRVHYAAAAAVNEPDRLLRELKHLLHDPNDDPPEAFWIHGPLNERAPELVQYLMSKLSEAGMRQTPLIYRGFYNDAVDPQILFNLAAMVGGISLIPELNNGLDEGNRLPVETVCASIGDGCPLFWEIPDPRTAVSVCRRVLKAGLSRTALVIIRQDLRHRVWQTVGALADAGLSANVALILRLCGDPIEQALSAGPALLESGGEALLAGPASGKANEPNPISIAFGILQSVRRRLTRAEFISCPSCGRTLFNLETTTERIRRRTGHLKGVKIAVMGCIVNGPGEMADADFGYVGSGVGKIDLYRGKIRVERNLAPDEADEALVALIKADGRWVDTAD